MNRDFKKYSDSRLALRMVKYTELTNSLIVQCEYYDGTDCPSAEREEIRSSYLRLKTALREDAYYCGFAANDNTKSSVYMNAFKPSILQAAANGMSASEDTPPGREMCISLRRTLEGFTKIMSFDEWEFLSEQK